MHGLAVVRDIAVVLAGAVPGGPILPTALLFLLSCAICKILFVGRASKSSVNLTLRQNRVNPEGESDISDHAEASRGLTQYGSVESGSHELRYPTTERREHCWVCAEWQFYEEYSRTGIVRGPLSLMHEIDYTMRDWIKRQDNMLCYGYLRNDDEECYGGLDRAWVKALASLFPRTPLAKLQKQDPSLLPLCLLQGFSKFQDLVVLRPKGIFAQETYEWSRYRCTDPLSVLAATSQCRFRKGFASEGMLCNDPPIPLRVLDFLESSTDLLNLARVCKATHQAGHVLLQRELPKTDLGAAIARRKRDMLQRAIGHPIPGRAAPTHSQALNESRGKGRTASDPLEDIEREIDEGDQVDFILLKLLEAGKRLKPPTAAEWTFSVYSDEVLYDILWRKMRHGLVVDGEGVERAVAMLEDRELRSAEIDAKMFYIDDDDGVRRVRNWRTEGAAMQRDWCALCRQPSGKATGWLC